MNPSSDDIICIGSVLWDIIGRSKREMRSGSDVPGRITRLPGGVAMNIAMTLSRFGLRPVLLSALGRDAEGDELLSLAEDMGMQTCHVHRMDDMPTDSYMAIEGANGLIAAIADAHSLEAAGAAILSPLLYGPLGSEANPYRGVIALDGNLTAALLKSIASSAAFAQADLRIAPASPGKAERLREIFRHSQATIYLNVEETELLTGAQFDTAQAAAQALVASGAKRAIVTNGAELACDADADGLFLAKPPRVTPKQITGAGDTFMAAHITAEMRGIDRQDAIEFAQAKAAAYVAGEDSNV